MNIRGHSSWFLLLQNKTKNGCQDPTIFSPILVVFPIQKMKKKKQSGIKYGEDKI